MTASNNFSTIPEELKGKMKKFRFRKEKTIAAIILKINKDNDEVMLEEELEDCTIEEIQEEISAQQPRYIVISYKYTHGDGRVSYPIFFVYYSPGGCSTALQMRYAGTKSRLQQELGITKTFIIEDIEVLTSEYLDAQVEFYR